MNPQISARAFEEAIECGRLKRGPDDDDRALCLIPRDVPACGWPPGDKSLTMTRSVTLSDRAFRSIPR
jgi:hypothetical protein